MANPESGRDILIERVATAFRERDAEGRVVASPAWWDLAPEDREVTFDLQLLSRCLERAADPKGLSTTARAVLARVKEVGRLE